MERLAVARFVLFKLDSPAICSGRTARTDAHRALRAVRFECKWEK